MRRLMVVTKFDQVQGFRLAGISAIGVDHIQDVNELISTWLKNKDEILLALDDSLYVQLDERLISQIHASDDMLIVTIPDGPVTGAEASRKGRIYDMIRHATGAQFRFKGESHG